MEESQSVLTARQSRPRRKRSASCVCVLKDCVLECDAERGGGSLKRVGVTPWQDCAAVCTSQSYDRGQE